MPHPSIDISDCRKRLNSMDERLKVDRVVVVVRHNKPAFALVDCEYISALLEAVEIMNNPDDLMMLMHGIEGIRAGRLRDHEDVERELG